MGVRSEEPLLRTGHRVSREQMLPASGVLEELVVEFIWVRPVSLQHLLDEDVSLEVQLLPALSLLLASEQSNVQVCWTRHIPYATSVDIRLFHDDAEIVV